jgi:hypothetical protein
MAERDQSQGHAFVFGGKNFNFNKDTNVVVGQQDLTPSEDEIVAEATKEPVPALIANLSRLEKLHKRINQMVIELENLDKKKRK